MYLLLSCVNSASIFLYIYICISPCLPQVFQCVWNLLSVRPSPHRVEALPDSLFRSGYLQVECLAKFGDFLFDKTELALARKEPEEDAGYGRDKDR